MQKVKNHIEKHKASYLVGTGVVVGVAAGVVIGRGDINVIVKSKNVATGNGIVTVLQRRGHPGIVVRHVETGELFASMRRAREALNVTPQTMKKMVESGALELIGDAADLGLNH